MTNVPLEPSPPPRRSRQKQERGIALLMVLTMVVMFTAFVTDFGYTSRIKYAMASHTRDAAKAQALAVSGIRIYLLLLKFGDALQGNARNMIPSQYQNMIPTGSIVTQMIPCLDTGLLRALGGGEVSDIEDVGMRPQGNVPSVVGEDSEQAPVVAEDDRAMGDGSFLGFEGDFLTCAKEETSKISLKSLASGDLNSPAAQMLLAILKKEEYQPLLREINLMPEELLSNIIDWADFNGERANGKGYEDNLYNNLQDPYQSKNANYDTVAELHSVAGMTDELYDIIAPQVTPFTDADKVSLPIAGPLLLEAVIRAALPNVRQLDMEQIWTNYQIQTALMQPDSPQALVAILKLCSTSLSALTVDEVSKFVDTSSKKRPKVFALTSTGRVGEVERTIQIVVHLSYQRQDGRKVIQILYWREE